mmetsp:Transcript_27146/g.33745  ORF Transcript_27146/g.33745 Transcript_27146/m.33745 type:complete len:285 (-) Transcript_27146:34-888(-)|eukprot:CAMPEP_0170465634 /NCGR_PEP_ID=MMETSP0123-20130129/9908_1 /TAXON_ID=182087 /ORGANISM="Favella ehrenbergii, Strain Fehren 1" /LENGTH=284 /DNA_ID=CAMNT_0010731587 /DNA_START=395 /DNA_END=1249 /DNA_ORIENTATION=+
MVVGDYMALLNMIKPDVIVSPIEQVTNKCGKRKVGRAIRNAHRTYADMRQAAQLQNSKLLYPVLYEQADDFFAQLDADLRGTLDGVMLFNGLENLSLAARFDSVSNLRQSLGDNAIIGTHVNATPLIAAVLSLAGIDFFQTDYPLELALDGKALRLISNPEELAGIKQADLTTRCKIAGSIASDPLGVALAAEQLSDEKVVFDLTDDPQLNRANAEPLQPGCQCYTCANYSISYLIHLHDVKEMNYNILLAIHNMHTMDKLFEAMQRDGASADYISAFLLKNFL